MIWAAVEAIGTVGTLAASLVLIRAQLVDRRRAQASQIGAELFNTRSLGDGRALVTVRVTNNSTAPVYELHAIAPGQCARPSPTSVLLPNRQVDLDVDVYGRAFSQLGGGRNVGVEFRDTYGRIWSRLPDGRLFNRWLVTRLADWKSRHAWRSGKLNALLVRVVDKTLWSRDPRKHWDHIL